MHAIDVKSWDGDEGRVSGESALLLLPGWDADPELVQSLAQQLARRFRVLTPGELEPGVIGARRSRVFDASCHAIEQSGAQDVVIAAVGQAGWTAIALRQKLGRRVRALVLLEWSILVETWPLKEGSPLAALSRLAPPVPVLHLYAQPRTPDFLVVQQGYARSHRWFNVELLEAGSQFPALERPHAVAHAINRFASAEPE